MIDSISIIKEEHEGLNRILTEVDQIINSDNEQMFMTAGKKLKGFKKAWDKHEIMEEKFFDTLTEIGKYTPEKAEESFVSEHKELRGHWKILSDAVNTDDPEEVRVALDTDGRMLIEKFRKHMAAEEKFFNTLID